MLSFFSRIYLAEAAAQQPVDVDALQQKIAAKQYDKMSAGELNMAMKMELRDGVFGDATKFAYQKLVEWMNNATLYFYYAQAQHGLTDKAGGPIQDPEIKLPNNPAFAQRPESFTALLATEQLTVDLLKTMQNAGQVTTDLILDSGTPGDGKLNKQPDQLTSDFQKMERTWNWICETQQRINGEDLLIQANQRYRVMNEILGINKPGYAPPEDPSKLMAYCDRADDVTNLMFRVRNYAEAIKTLQNTKGQFESNALDADHFPGTVKFDATGRITSMSIDLPDSLAVTPDNERKLNRLRQWLNDNSKQVDEALKDYAQGDFIGYGDYLVKGQTSRDASGNVVRVKDDENHTILLRQPNGELANMTLSGELMTKQRQKVDENQKDGSTHSDNFDYVHKSFSVSPVPNSTDGSIQVTFDRGYREDTFYNYNRWMGTNVGDVSETRVYKPTDYVAVQNTGGKVELVRADRLQEWLTVQSFFEDGGKLANAAADVGMVISGTVGARAAITAGRYGLAAINVGRATLGALGVADPMLRQWGETGAAIEKGRHIAIMLDVTQGLLRGGIGKVGELTVGKTLLETKGALEVSQVIKASTALRRFDLASRAIFFGCDAVWGPSMYSALSDKIHAKTSPSNASQYDKANNERGGGLGETGKQPTTQAAEQPVDWLKASQSILQVYNKVLDEKDAADQTAFAAQLKSAQEKLGAGQNAIDAYRNDELIKVFKPSQDQMKEYEQQHEDTLFADIAPREKQASSEEKVAAAISMLYTGMKDGKLPADGVLATRTVTVPGYEYQKSDGNDSTYTVTVPDKTVVQQVKVEDMVAVLQEAALNSPSQATRLMSADALFRCGQMSPGSYGGVCLDLLNDPATANNRDLKTQAIGQLFNLIEVSALQENDKSLAPEDAAKRVSASYGLSSQEMMDRLQKTACNEADPDLRALAAAAIFAHKHDNADDLMKTFSNDFTKMKDHPGAFHDKFIADLNKELAMPLSVADNDGFDKARAARLDAITGLDILQGSKKETIDQKMLSNALLQCLDMGRNWFAKDQSEIKDIALTKQIYDRLLERRDCLTPAQQAQLRDRSVEILKIAYPDGNDTKTDEFKQRVAMLQTDVINNLDKTFSGSTADDTKLRQSMKQAADALTSWIKDDDPQGIKSGWGQFASYRIAALRGLVELGVSDKDTLDEIQCRLNYDASKTDQTAFYEQNPAVRAAAVEALYTLGEHRFRYKEDDIKGMDKDARATLGVDGKFYVEELLKRERDPESVRELYRVYDRLHVPDFSALDRQRLYEKEVENLRNASQITVTKEQVVSFINEHQKDLGLLTADSLGNRRTQVEQQQYEKEAPSNWRYLVGWLPGVEWHADVDARAHADAKQVSEQSSRAERDAQMQKLVTDQLSDGAIKTLLYMIVNPDQICFEPGEQMKMRVVAAQMLESLCRLEQKNGNQAGNKELLGQAVTYCLLNSSDMVPGAKSALLDALDDLTVADEAQIAKADKQNQGHWLITPEKQAQIICAVLHNEAGHKYDKPGEMPRREFNRDLQLRMLNKLCDLRCKDAIPMLLALSSDAAVDAGNTGSYLPEVRIRAGQVLGIIRDGVVAQYTDAMPERNQSLTRRAGLIDASLKLPGKYNYEDVCTTIFHECKGAPIKYESDLRRDALKHALDHSSQRVQLAAAWMLSESTAKGDVKTATQVLARLSFAGENPEIRKEAKDVLQKLGQNGGADAPVAAVMSYEEAFDKSKLNVAGYQVKSAEAETMAKPSNAILSMPEETQLDNFPYLAEEDEGRRAALAIWMGRQGADFQRLLEPSPDFVKQWVDQHQPRTTFDGPADLEGMLRKYRKQKLEEYITQLGVPDWLIAAESGAE
ncbi:MAG TPA: hypothetical protein V6C69_14450 [Trichormus sp.]